MVFSFVTTVGTLALALANSVAADPSYTIEVSNPRSRVSWWSTGTPFVVLDGAAFVYQSDGNLVVVDPHSAAVLWNSGTSGIADCSNGRCAFQWTEAGSLVMCQNRGGNCDPNSPGNKNYLNTQDYFFWGANGLQGCGCERPPDRMYFQSGPPYIALLVATSDDPSYIEWCTDGYSDYNQANPDAGCNECPAAGSSPGPNPPYYGPNPPPGGWGKRRRSRTSRRVPMIDTPLIA